MAFDLILAIQRSALLAVVRKPAEYHLREIFRWYSETFHTPLREVDAIPLEEVCQHYFERMYRDMEGPDLEQELFKLSRTEAELLELDRKKETEAVSDDSAHQALMKQLDEAKKAGQTLADLLSGKKKAPIKTVSQKEFNMKKAPLPPLPEPSIELPEGIRMQFTEDGDLTDDPSIKDEDPLTFSLFGKK